MKTLQHQHPGYATGSPADDWTPVLVAVVNNRQDLIRARDEHWYRIPIKRAPRQIAAEYLALYQTGKFGAQGHRISVYAPILRYHVATRAELIPDQAQHPRAQDQYFKLELGDFITLPQPIANSRQPRLTFIITTLARLHHAHDVSDLWLRAAARQKLYAEVRERGLAVECWYPVAMGDRPEADLALLGPNGRITLYIDEAEDWEFGESGPIWHDAKNARVNALDLLKNTSATLEKLLATHNPSP